MNAKLVVTVILGSSLISLCGCTTTTSGGAVGAERKQLMLVSSQQLEQVSSEAYTKLLAAAADQGVLNTDAEKLRRVREIAARLAPRGATFRADAPTWNWEANVIDSDELNAFCMPGGKILVYSGLIDHLRLTENELAVVLGHEVAHALREHSREQLSQAIAAQSAIGIGAAVFGLGQTTANLAGAGYQALLATKFSRTDESEADRIGLELAAPEKFSATR